MKKDKMELDMNKLKMIEEVKKLDKDKMFIPTPPPKQKKSVLTKILNIFGYGKKR